MDDGPRRPAILFRFAWICACLRARRWRRV